MIINTILDFLYNVSMFFISLLPNSEPIDADIINNIHNAFMNIRNIIAWANFFFPVDTLFQVITLLVSFYLLAFTYALVMFGLGLIKP